MEQLSGLSEVFSNLCSDERCRQAGVEAALKDDVPREDRGAQSWTKDKAVRVLRIFLKTLDPKEVQKALEGLYQVVLSVVATLRLRFAAAVTLGCAVGDIFRKAAELVARPRLEEALAPDYHKWIDTLIEYGCKASGIMLAWMLERVIGALHCSLRGAQLLVKHGQEAANRANLLPQHLKLAEGSPTFTAVVGAVAAVGFINQVATSFSLPAPLALFLLPLSLVEWTLTLFVGWV
mmetsp:Transcript_29364/g.77134  ORF Transcript_29364/g.77134 Transcript_29364/m.77134 type:complete len:235 (-) Transcript_29364:29-733(-)